MLNSTIFGGMVARSALAKNHLAGTAPRPWCVGGCKSWKKTKEGRDRFAALRRINEERKKKGLSHL
jgi:hypothetical protein